MVSSIMVRGIRFEGPPPSKSMAVGIAMAVTVGALLILAVESVSIHRDNSSLYEHTRLLERKVERLEVEKDSLAREHAALAQDPFYVERLLIERNVVRPGERIIKSQ